MVDEISMIFLVCDTFDKDNFVLAKSTMFYSEETSFAICSLNGKMLDSCEIFLKQLSNIVKLFV